MSKIKVFVVDDSAVVRQVVSQVLDASPAIQVLGTATDPIFALDKMQREWPDVIILDIEMPRMDGITFLRKIMAERPTPVVICSTLTERGAETTMQALSAGAVDIVTKPKSAVKNFLEESSKHFIDVVKGAAHANVKRLTPVATGGGVARAAAKHSADVIIAPVTSSMARTTECIVAMGTSTGGTQALERVLTSLPRTAPGIVIVQHMPEKFTEAFATRLNGLCEIEVKEAKANDRVIPGVALIAPGGRHMALTRSGAYYHVDVVDGPLVNRHRPSVDVLFRSVAKFAGKNALGIIMTGMGDDGARGLKEMHDMGATTLAQDEASCVVYGMPKEAVKLGAVDSMIALDRIPASIQSYASGKSQK